MWDATKVELFALGCEPDWLKEKRKRDSKEKRAFHNYPKNVDMPRSLDNETIEEIRIKKANGVSRTDLAKEYHVSISTIWRYVTDTRYKKGDKAC